MKNENNTILQSFSTWSNGMKTGYLLTLLLLFSFSILQAQTPAVDIPLTVSDGTTTWTLHFGLDPTATAGLDPAIGEQALPPTPPAGIFDTRFNLPVNNDASLKDYRQGTSNFQGSYTHTIQYQTGGSNSTIKLEWNLPAGVTGVLKDQLGGIVYNQPMNGSGSLTVTNPGAITKLDMTITYALSGSAPAAPVLAVPANGAVNIAVTPTLKWYKSTGATGYRLQVSTSQVFTSTAYDDSTLTDSIKQLSGLNRNTTYYWRVKAKNSIGSSAYSSIFSFTTDTGSAVPTAPVLSTPANGAANLATALTLNWGAVSGATSYRVQVSTSNTFTTTIINDSAVNTNSKAISGLSNNTVYYWRVNAKNSAGTSAYSSVFSFTTETGAVAPAAPVLSAPANGATAQATALTLNWGVVNGATSYRVQVSTSNTFATTIVNDSTVTTNSKAISGLNNNTMYYWRVSAKNSFGTSSYSSIFSFTTVGSTPGLVYDLPFTATDNAGGTSVLRFGIAADATDDIDTQYGEQTMPPMPPSGVFDARFNLPVNNYTSLKDYRQGDANTQLTRTYEVQYQVGGGTSITLSWNLPAGVTGLLQDLFGGIIVNRVMSGVGSYTVTNPAVLTKLNMIMTYSPGSNSVPPAIPQLVSPLNGATGNSLNPVLAWRSVPNANKYELQVSTTANFSNIIISDSTLTDTVKSITGLANGATYYWRVRAGNAYGFSNYSTAYGFTTIASVVTPEVPVLVAPANGAAGQATALTLSWNAAAGVDRYRIQLATNNTFANLLIDDSTLTVPYKAVDGLTNNTTYYWRVKAGNAAGSSAYSSVFSFTTIGSMAGVVYNIPLTITDNAGGSSVLRFGLAPNATDSIDSQYGEQLLPPMPPSGIFDARFNLAYNNASSYDFRQGNANFTGQKTHEIQFQPGAGSSISIQWNFPAQITGRLQDVVTGTLIDISMSGSGSYTVSNPAAFFKLKFTAIYQYGSGIVPPVAPYLAAPVSGAQNVTVNPQLVWNKALGATQYHLQVSANANFSSLLVNDSLLTDTVRTISGLEFLSTYYWRVRSKNTAGSSPFSVASSFTTGISTVPLLLQPVNGAVNVAVNPELQWQPFTNAVSYELQVATDSLFTNPIYIDTSITGNSRQISQLLNNAVYYWRVRANLAAGKTGFSKVRNFTVIPPLPGVPSLASPVNNAGGMGTSIGFKWNKVQDAVRYQLQVATTAAFSAVVYNDSTITDTTKLVTGLLGNSQYYWRVRSLNAAGVSVYSAVFSFRTLLVAPEAPVLLLPENNALYVAINPVIKWARSAGASSYRLQISALQNFSSLVVNDSTLTDTTAVINALSGNTNYYWRVNATNAAGTSFYSPIYSFTTIANSANIAIDIPVVVISSNNASRELHLGIAPTATDGIDPAFGEYALPPVPPSGVFDARFVLGSGDNTLRDYRNGAIGLVGQKDHIIRFQPNTNGGIILNYTLPFGVSGRIQDLVNGSLINVQISGSGSYSIPNPQVLDRVKLSIFYNLAAPAVPTLYSPTNNATAIPVPVALKWGKVALAEKYSLQVSDNSSFSNIIYQNQNLTDTTQTITQLNNLVVYYWRVQAVNRYGTGNYSSTFNFKTVISEPGPATLSSPANGSTGTEMTLSLSWQPGNAAMTYKIEVAKDSLFQNVTKRDSGLTNTSYTLSGLNSNQTYFWRVYTVNTVGTAVSQIWKFRTKAMSDLVVAQVTVPPDAYSNQNYVVSWVVSNSGTGTTGSARWYDYVYLSTSPVYNSGTAQLLGYYLNPQALNVGESYQNTATYGLPQGQTGTYYVFVIADRNNNIPELSDSNNMTRSGAMNVQLTPPPNMKVSSIIPPNLPYSGETVPITYTIKNAGPGATVVTTWHDAVYLSNDSILNTSNDVLLGVFQHSGSGILGANQEYSVTKQVTLPQAIWGYKYYFVTSDVYNEVYEYIYENDNSGRSDSSYINLTPPADLSVTSIAIPDTTGPGEKITVSFTVKNIGVNSPFESGWTDRIYITKSSVFNPDSVLSSLDTYRNGPLAPQASYTVNREFTIPNSITGSFHIWVKTDYNDQIFEFDRKQNNLRKSDNAIVVGRHDLQILQVTCPDTANPSQQVNINYAIRNQGSVKMQNRQWKDVIYLSKSAEFNLDSAIVIGTVSQNRTMLPQVVANQVQAVTIPLAFVGSCYVFVKTDADNAVFEDLGEGNNITRSTGSIFIKTIDLTAGAVIAPQTVSPTEVVSVSYTATNIGTANISNLTWQDKIYISKTTPFNADSSRLLLSIAQNRNLLPNQSYNESRQVTIPADIAGTYRIYIKTDANNELFESNGENNNVASAPNATVIGAVDLLVSAINNPATISPGETLTVSYTVINNGTGNLINRSWQDKIFMSKKNTFVLDSCLEVAALTQNRVLAPQQPYVVSKEIVIPNNSNGKYYFYVYTDFKNEIVELGGEFNNTLRSTGSTEIRLPNLTVSAITLPDTGRSGQMLNITYTVKNAGSGAVINRTWGDEVYISQSGIFDSLNATLLSSQVVAVNLQPDSVYAKSLGFQLPNGVTGSFYIYVRTEYSNAITEANESDNITRSAALFVKLSPAPDLRIVSVNAPSEVSAGQQTTVAWVVKNYGQAVTNTDTWKDRLYLSASSTWDSTTALLIADVTHIDSLDTAKSYSASTSFIVPATISGVFYVYVKTDYTNTVYEFVNESNNIKASNPMLVQPYPQANLSLVRVVSPDTVATGKTVRIVWEVKNLSIAKTLASYWVDAVYLSLDTVYQSGVDRLLYSASQYLPLMPNESYIRSADVPVPNTINGLPQHYYLLTRIDTLNAALDGDLSNNISHNPVQVERTPPSDLAVEAIVAPDSAKMSQPVTLRWTVKNRGVGATQNPVWYDAVYISRDSLFTQAVKYRLGDSTHTGILDANASYTTATLNFRIPNLTEEGFYYFIVQTDDRNDVFEFNAEQNNLLAKKVFLQIPPPADLEVTQIDLPDNVEPGKEVTVTYTLRNVGYNPAVGYVTDAVFFSADSILTIADPLLGYSERYINLARGESVRLKQKIDVAKTFSIDANGNITGAMPGLPLGEYRAIVKANILNSIPDTNYNNNKGISPKATRVVIPSIALGIPEITHFTANSKKYFRIFVQADQDLKVRVTSNKAGAMNYLYIKYEQVPELNKYDYASIVPFSATQELLIPSTHTGNYYIMITTDVVPGNDEEVTLMATALPFSILAVQPNSGGTGGIVTGTITGAGFRDSMQVFLKDFANNLYPGTILEFKNTTQIVTQFDLNGILPNAYTVVLKKKNTAVTELANGFTVTEESPLAQLNAYGPGSIRQGLTQTYDVLVSNMGNVDLEYPLVLFGTSDDSYIRISHITNDHGEVVYGAGDPVTGIMPLIIDRNLATQKTVKYRVDITGLRGGGQPYLYVKAILTRNEFNAYTRELLWKLLRTGNAGLCPDAFTAHELETMFTEVMRSSFASWWSNATGKSFAALLRNEMCSYLNAHPVANTTCFDVSNQSRLLDAFTEMNNGIPRLRLQNTCDSIATLNENYSTMLGIRVIVPVDPNDMYGPQGYGAERWISKGDILQYRINFENDPKRATAPAQVVRIELPLDAELDPYKFALSSFGFGSFNFVMENNPISYSDLLLLEDSLGVNVNVRAGIDLINNKAYFYFSSVSPVPGGSLPATAGFLPVNDSITHRGQGNVNFTIYTRENVKTRDSLHAVARIVFDNQSPLETPAIFNTVDAAAPQTRILSLPQVTDSTSFKINVVGRDDSLGSGLRDFSLYVSENNGPYHPVIEYDTVTSRIFNGSQGSLYSFKVLGRDQTLNMESKPSPDVTVRVGGVTLGEQRIGLHRGWNMISGYVRPKHPAMKTLFDQMSTRLLLLKDGSGNTFIPQLRIQALNEWSQVKGFKAYLTEPDTLTLVGTIARPSATPIILNQGWNLAAYLRDTVEYIDSALTTIAPTLKLAKNGAGLVYWPEYGINTIGLLEAGQGYQMYVTAPDTLIYHDKPNQFKRAMPKLRPESEYHFQPLAVNTDNNAVLLVTNLTNSEENEIAAYSSSGNIIGRGRVSDGKCAITLWGDNQMTTDTVEGALENERLMLEMWCTGEQKSYPLSIRSMQNGLTSGEMKTTELLYNQNMAWVITVDEASPLPRTYSLDQNYPNPFNPTTTIRFGVPENARVTINLYNILGERVKTLLSEDLKAGYHTCTFNGLNLASGVYFYRLESKKFTLTKKMLLLK